jgi:hypothetical protein
VVKLFNLSDDPLELHDLAAEKIHQDRISMMYGELQQLMVEMGDTLQLQDLN